MAFVMDRGVPPTLSDVSHARIRAGLLTDADVMGTVTGEDVQTLSIWTERFRRLKEFAAWATRTSPGASISARTGASCTAGATPRRMRYRACARCPAWLSAKTSRPIGYRLEPETMRPGEPARLTLYWQATGPLPQDYQVLVHLARPGEPPVAQADSGPLNGLYPTARWQPGEILADVHWLTVPPGTPPGEYGCWPACTTPGPCGACPRASRARPGRGIPYAWQRSPSRRGRSGENKKPHGSPPVPAAGCRRDP